MDRSHRDRRYRFALGIDKRFGPALCRLLYVAKWARRHLRQREFAQPVRRILVLKFWGMGSIVLASPLVQELQRRHPGAQIDVVTLRENEAAVRLLGDSIRPRTLDLERGIPMFLIDTLMLLWRLRRERHDLLLDLEFFTRFSAIFSLLARAARSHGFSTKGSARGSLHDVEVPFNAYHHVAVNFLTILFADPTEPLPIAPGTDGPMLPPIASPPAARAALAVKLSTHPAFRSDRPTVVVNPNAGGMALERRWPREQCAALLRSLAAGNEFNVVLTGSSAERSYVESVAGGSGVGAALVNLAGSIDIDELVALFELAAVVVTNDSGPLHIACAAGAPTVALFGPETPTLYGPLRSRPAQRHIVHNRHLACSPCLFVHDNKVASCWYAQARCMTDIAPADVERSVRELLAWGRLGGIDRDETERCRIRSSGEPA